VKKPVAPILEFPGSGKSIIEPARLKAGQDRIPGRCVLCFFSEVIKKLRRKGELKQIHQLTGEGDPNPVYIMGRGKKKIAVCWPGVTAPFASVVLEELIALGGRKFIACGGAGVLDSTIPPGKLIVPTAALRDEGTSYHYQKSGRFSRPHPDAVRAIEAACRLGNREILTGKTWTTDAVFRETPRMIKRRGAEGCITVEMEAAAFFAVARFRKVRFGQILYAGDDVSGSTWDPRGWSRRFDVREELFWLAVDACRRL
jgi:purine-nucleoside phosphorylase